VNFEHRITGHDVVRALLLAGYRLAGGEMGHAIVGRGETLLAVPQRQLQDGEIVSLLDSAGILPLEFLVLLNRMASRETLPDPAEAATTALAENG
jgi:transcriptional regulator of NAD metabolism